MSKQKNIFSIERGFPLPGGAATLEEGINFSIFSRHASRVTLVLQFEEEEGIAERVEIELDPAINRTGDIWHILLQTREKQFYYGYRMDGESDIDGKGHFYDRELILLDPFCQNIKGRPWGAPSPGPDVPLCTLTDHDFDWQDDRPLKTPMVDSVIYELHVRGFTNHPSAQVKHPGTYLGIIDKIPYLKELGVTAVELMPVTEWDENDNLFFDPESGALLKNYWGYNPISFCALKSGFAANPAYHINEFKTMVRSLHKAGIEVILDMVYNLGIAGFKRFKNTIRYARTEQWEKCAAEMINSKWAMQVGQRATRLAEIIRTGVMPERFK